MSAMTEISTFPPSQPVRITISVEGGLAPAVMAQLRHSLPPTCLIALQEAPPEAVAMTARQRQILQLLAAGMSNKDIGRRLGLSHFTVRNHVSQLLRLLGVSSRKAATGMMLDGPALPHGTFTLPA